MPLEPNRVSRDKLYTVRETAELFGLTEQTIRLWIKRGKLPSRQVGRRHLIKGRDIQQQLGG